MFDYSALSINKKLRISFLGIGVIPLVIFAVVGLISMHNSSIDEAFDQLESVRNAKASQLETYFNDEKTQGELVAKIVDTLKTEGEQKLELTQHNNRLAVENYLDKLALLLKSEADSTGAAAVLRAPGSDAVIKGYEASLAGKSLANHIEDIYILSNQGKVLYASKRKSDVGMQLSESTYQDFGLSKVWSEVKENGELRFANFSQSSVTGDDYLAYLAEDIIVDGKPAGMVAISFTNEMINALIHSSNGLGASAETYIATSKEGGLRFVSDMQTMGDGLYKVGYEMENPPEYVTATFMGESINEIFKDSSGNMVVVSTDPIQVVDQQWIMVTKVDLEDLINQVDDEGNDFYSSYVSNNQYDDIFLIHPDGYVFYSVQEGYEFKANLLQGELANTNHADLVRQVKERKSVVFVDYEANALNNYVPRAFLGIPVFDSENKVEFIMSFEVSSDAINAIMLDRTGLGEYGEAYLIGSDYRLRSDTFLEPLVKNVSNSFINPSEGGIYSEAAHAVVSGKSDTRIQDDYRGEASLISYEPIHVSGSQWGLVVKQDKSERLSSMYRLIFFIVLLGAATIGIVMFLAHYISTGISRPIIRISEWAKDVAFGKLEFNEIKTSNDEIGELKNSITKVVESFSDVSEICEDIAIGKLDHDFQIRSEDDVLGNAINRMRANFIEVIDQANAISEKDYAVTIDKRSENDELGAALINMVTQLKTADEFAKSQNWMKSGQSELNEIIQETSTNQELSKRITAFVSQYLEAHVSSMYVKAGDCYNMLGSYAMKTRTSNQFKITEGDGVLGQAILEKELIYLKDIPSENMLLSTSSAQVEIKHVIIMPCIFEGDVKGIIEIGAYTPFSDLHLEFLEKIQENIAIAIHSNITKQELQDLLDRTLLQSETLKKNEEILKEKNEELSQQTDALRASESKLQQQQEELRQSNEELEAQTMELKASESKLQQQQEELRVTNEELEEKTINLQKQTDEVAKKNEELERTQNLIEEKAKEIEISSKYKSEFLANMSHELRTPLNSILILSGLLHEDKKGVLTDEEKEYVKVINAAGKDLLELINDILDLSKIESGKMELNIENFNLRSALDTIHHLFKPLTDEKGIALVSHVEAAVPEMVRSDEMKVMQVVKNLVSNAVKFTEEGQISITTSLENKDMLKISIQDTGIGIPKEKLLHIFGAFQQVDGSTSRNYGGTGLGLSISKELIQLVGGSITVESEEQRGSIFNILIPVEISRPHSVIDTPPLVSSSSFDDQTETRSAGAVGTRETGKDPVRDLSLDEIKAAAQGEPVILIVEDDQSFAGVLSKIAKERGHRVFCVESGERALLVAEDLDISAIILDLGLPGMGGWEVLHRLKKWDRTKDIPVHIISGRELDHQHENQGFIDYLQKPVSFEKLAGAFDKIEELINTDIKKLLLVTSDVASTKQIKDQFEEVIEDLKLDCAYSGEDALEILKKHTFDCMVMVDDLEDISIGELAKRIRVNDLSQTPIILYTDSEKTSDISEELARYIESIILKGEKSMDRLIDETTLFLNHIEESNKVKSGEYMRTNKEKEAILRGKKVLIVDDDMRNTFALSSALEEEGIDIVIAKNGQIAIEKLEESPDIDIVLMDIMMPVMDGYTAMRKIRSMKASFSGVPIIALTAKAMREDKEKCISAGASDYLAKPIKFDELLTLMKVWIY